MSVCGKCGQSGHNARSCGKQNGAPKPKPAKLSAEPLSVTEALSLRRDALKRELSIIERVLGELGAIA